MIFWDANSSIVVVVAERSLGSVLRRMREESADWIVVVRCLLNKPEVYYYAFRSSEVEHLGKTFPDRLSWPIGQAMDMHEWMSSGTCRGRRPSSSERGQAGPAAARVVDFDAGGRIAAIGEPVYLTDPPIRDGSSIEPLGNDLENILGPTRGGRSFDIEHEEIDEAPEAAPDWVGAAPAAEAEPEAEPADAKIEVTLSAETKAEIQVGANEVVDFRIDLSSEALPLAVSQAARAKADVPIVVSLSAENDAIEIMRDHERSVDPPTAKKPQVGFFLVKGVRAGLSRLAVAFRQGGTELGVISLATEVVETGARSEMASGKTTAAPRDLSDDDKLALIVEQRVEGGEVFYQYILHSETLGLPYLKLRSKALLDRGGGSAATPLAFVEHIYERVTQELKSFDDLKELQREARALGAKLCQELFDPEVAKKLWPLRDRIRVIQVVSWEPYIPWELVRLENPDSGEIDDRFLAEYGLVRTLSDDMPPRELPMAKWGYVAATFPMGSFPPVGAELDYFKGMSSDSLQGHGIRPLAIPATRDAFYDALAKGDLDVLHISCHAESPHQSIERASLILGDETPAGDSKPRLIEVDTITVEAEARLKSRRPLVFLNGCETGRTGAVLTAWGGWPNVFLRAGAGAFVGSAWAVRDKPAGAFSTEFYNALLAGSTLAEAASAARASAKKLGDASWLAFKVYGHPRARRMRA
jgi:hypothetical protein